MAIVFAKHLPKLVAGAATKQKGSMMFIRGAVLSLVFALPLLLTNATAQAVDAVSPGADGTETVYAGCTVPQPPSSVARAFYVDPLHGSLKGDGSRGRPWRTLAEVVAAGYFATAPTRPNSPPRRAPIKPGDTVYLMSGNHGIVTFQGQYGPDLPLGYNNSDFITITAYPGQTPVLEQLAIKGGSKWIFRGLTFRSTYKNVSRGDYWLVSLWGTHENIIFDANRFESQADVSGWTMRDWSTKRASGLQDVGGNCVAITGNTFRNIGFGMQTQRSDRVLIARNSIDHFSDDGIDYGSDDNLIENNTITNSIEDGDGMHRDAMQGQPVNEQAIVQNVTIQNNHVIRLTDPNLSLPGLLNGIDTFDGIWNNVVVRGNVVITDSSHGISYYGSHHVIIANNIIMADSLKVMPCLNMKLVQCEAQVVTYDTSMVPRLVISPGKSGAPSSDVQVIGNIVDAIAINGGTVDATVTGNACVSTGPKCVMGFPTGGRQIWVGKPGNYGGNVVFDGDPSDVFVLFDPLNEKYDLTIKSDPRPDAAN